MRAAGVLSLYANEAHGYAAFWKPGSSIAEVCCSWTPEYRQAIGFVPLLKNLADRVQEEGTSLWTQVGTVLAPKGPTSFTTLRITLSVARAVAFSIPETQIFAPSQFHVQALSVEADLKANKGLLLLNAFKPGFYGAVMAFSPSMVPCFLEPPAYYTPEAGAVFLEKYEHLPVFTDLPETTKLGRQVQPLRDHSLAKTQIELFQRKIFPNDTFDYASLTPFYLDTPSYRKIF